MAYVRCEIIRWVADEPRPGLVEARLVEVEGQSWTFIDKAAIFSGRSVTGSTPFPVEGSIRCLILGRALLSDGTTAVTVDTERPDGVESLENSRTQFRVAGADVNP